jgi:hypothetical protein
MSDIIYTPPASSGGTTINSNNNFIPVRQNATTFVDSLLFSTTTILKSVFSGTDKGIIFDYLNNIFTYGTANSGMLLLPSLEVILQSNGIPIANLDGVNNVGYFGGAGSTFRFDGNNNKCNIGDGNGNYNTTYLEVDDLNQIIQTFKGNAKGLSLDFANRIYLLGDFAGINNGTSLIIAESNDIIETGNIQGQQGISLNFASKFYKFGDYDALGNNTFISVKDGGKEINLFTNAGNIFFDADALIFTGASLQSNTSGGNSGEHLVITLNGSQYKIKLENP